MFRTRLGPPQIAAIRCHYRSTSPPEERLYCPPDNSHKVRPVGVYVNLQDGSKPAARRICPREEPPDGVVSYTALICAGITNSFPAKKREWSSLRPTSSHPFRLSVKISYTKTKDKFTDNVCRYSREFSSLSSIWGSRFRKRLACVGFQKPVLNPDRKRQPEQLQCCCLHHAQWRCSCPVADQQ